MSRIGIAILLVACCLTHASAQESERVFIPHTPLTGQELQSYKAELISDHGWSEATAEEFVRGASREHFRFTDEDFRRAFSEILPSDTQASLCSNSIMSGATRLIYLSATSENSVTVKTSSCGPVEGGLSCAPLSVHETYFFESPDHRFTLDDDVSLEEAKELLTMYRDHGLHGLPEWYQRQKFGYKDVNHIGKTGIWYVLHLGEHFCRGCTATFKVVVDAADGAEPVLVLDAEPEGLCI